MPWSSLTFFVGPSLASLELHQTSSTLTIRTSLSLTRPNSGNRTSERRMTMFEQHALQLASSMQIQLRLQHVFSLGKCVQLTTASNSNTPTVHQTVRMTTHSRCHANKTRNAERVSDKGSKQCGGSDAIEAPSTMSSIEERIVPLRTVC